MVILQKYFGFLFKIFILEASEPKIVDFRNMSLGSWLYRPIYRTYFVQIYTSYVFWVNI